MRRLIRVPSSALRATFVLAPSLFALAGCPPVDDKDDTGGDSGGVDCTTEARASLQLSVVDVDGQPITGASATFSKGESMETDCEVGYGSDNLLICGWEVSGDLNVTVQAAGFGGVSDTWTVTSDECHVLTVQDTVILETIATEAR